MLKFITASVAGAALLVATQATSEAAGRGCCGCGGVTYQAAPTYQAAAPGGYRSFSYQPGTAAPAYRTYSAPKKNPWDYPKTDSRRYSGGN
jgi:hypothetical protein